MVAIYTHQKTVHIVLKPKKATHLHQPPVFQGFKLAVRFREGHPSLLYQNMAEIKTWGSSIHRSLPARQSADVYLSDLNRFFVCFMHLRWWQDFRTMNGRNASWMIYRIFPVAEWTTRWHLGSVPLLLLSECVSGSTLIIALFTYILYCLNDPPPRR